MLFFQKKMDKTFKILAVSLVLALSLVSQAHAQTPTGPKLEIITPGDGQTIYGGKVPILVSAENFEIVDYSANTTPKVGQGHIHLWLDETNPTPENATKVIEDNFTYSDVPFGNHTLVAELVNNNHVPLTPPQKTTVNFTSAQLSSPQTPEVSGFDKKTATVILVVVALVILAAWWYTKDEDEEMEIEEKPKKTATKPKRTKKRK